MRIFGGFVELRIYSPDLRINLGWVPLFYVLEGRAVGILVETGPIFAHVQVHFMIFSVSVRDLFRFIRRRRNLKKGQKKRNRVRWGGGPGGLKPAEIFGFRTADPGVGDRKGVCCYRILFLFEILLRI